MRSSIQITKALKVALVLLGTASAFVHPFGNVRRQDNMRPILSDANLDPSTKRLFERACQNCHSEKTDWPWYSYVAPVSWLIERDVSTARAQMNFSLWGEYSAMERETLLAAIGAAVRNRQMPPHRFTLLHREAVLSVGDQEQIYGWAHAERRRLRPPVQWSWLFADNK